MTITYKQLIDKKACEKQRELFKKIFGQSVTLTKDIVKKYGSQFDVNWLAKNFLNEKDYREYYEKREPFLKEYNEKCEPFLKEYEEKRELLWKEYEENRDSFWKEYNEKCEPFLKEYNEKCEPFLKEYNEKRSIVFFEIVNNN